MQSLFDDVSDIKLPPDEKPPRNYKKVAMVAGIVVAAVALGAGGWFGYRVINPPKLTERRLPPNPESLMNELKDARDSIDTRTRDIYARIDSPFATVRAALNNPGDWCDILILHVNTKYCRAASDVRIDRPVCFTG